VFEKARDQTQAVFRPMFPAENPGELLPAASDSGIPWLVAPSPSLPLWSRDPSLFPLLLSHKDTVTASEEQAPPLKFFLFIIN
jgi:hypothetical protein